MTANRTPKRETNIQLIRSFIVVTLLLTIWLWGGCSSSEETGAARPAPAQEKVGPITTEPKADSGPAGAGMTGQPQKGRSPQVGDPAIRRGRDTVTASTQRVARSPAQRQPLVKPPDAMYTVQVGAYHRAPNALVMQKFLKKEHADQPVFNMFTASEGLYRVTIGKFETLREASVYRKQLMKDHPNKFTECWVTYIERSR